MKTAIQLLIAAMLGSLIFGWLLQFGLNQSCNSDVVPANCGWIDRYGWDLMALAIGGSAMTFYLSRNSNRRAAPVGVPGLLVGAGGAALPELTGLG